VNYCCGHSFSVEKKAVLGLHGRRFEVDCRVRESGRGKEQGEGQVQPLVGRRDKEDEQINILKF